MAWKLLRLTPLKPFFFGKESVFTNTNYAKSEYFPQQTQIVGALRLYWMEQNNLMRVHKDGKYVPHEKKEEARKLVGNAGALDFEKNSDLGALLHVSPMFIVQTQNECIKDILFEIPSDIVKHEYQNIIAKPKHLSNIYSSKPVVQLEGYDVKKGFVYGLGASSFWERYINNDETLPCIYEYNTIYQSHKQVGIALDKNKQTEEGKFYTKESYSLKKGYSLGLLVDIDDELLAEDKLETLKDGILSLGADSSMFTLKVSNIPTIISQNPLILSMQNLGKKKGKKIVLLSDSILQKSIQNHSFFQIVPHKVPFKMMQSKKIINVSFKERKASYSKTEERLLVPKGSIYYFKNNEQLEEAKCAYAKMGFNQYLVLN